MREDPPARLGGPDPVRRRFRRRACRGIRDEPVLEGVPTDALGTVMPGSGACEARRYASGARGGGEGAPGRSRGGLTTETHAAVDGPGRPPCLLPTPGRAADRRQARAPLEGLALERPAGDRGCGTDEPRDRAEEPGAEAVIPSKRNREAPIPGDRAACRERHRVENPSCRLEDRGRVVPRERETSRGHAGFVSPAFALANLQLCPWTLMR